MQPNTQKPVTFKIGNYEYNFYWWECGMGCCAKWYIDRPPAADDTPESTYVDELTDSPQFDDGSSDAPQQFETLTKNLTFDQWLFERGSK
jgi:hypothetical protein